MSQTMGLSNLSKFIVDNSIVGTTAGVCIAIATKDFIQALVSDIVIPVIYLLLLTINGKYFTSILPSKTTIDFNGFAKHFITWLLLLFITYYFITITFNMLLGTSNAKPTESNDKNKK